MVDAIRGRPSWAVQLLLLLSVLQQVLAYRPVQHCKIIGDNGHYSACAALTQFYNTTTGESDLYVKYHWFRYRNSKNGWHSFALGQKMDGAFMLLMYGDPSTPGLPMTVDVRTSDGHQPPRPIAEIARNPAAAPQVDVVTAVFEEYNGDLRIESLNEKPTHVGICEAIIRGYEKWAGFKLSNTSTNMDMLWSSNYKQDMHDDFSLGRAIDMHQFGLGFGFLYVDMLNAVTPEPMFGPLDELAGMKGVSETRDPAPPTEEELAAGATYVAQQQSGSADPAPTQAATPTRSVAVSTATSVATQDDTVEQPVRTILGKTIRDWMWHLHGLLMTLAFFILYPFGTYMIRSGSSNAFNSHWTIQSLATVAMVIGSVIGYINSHSISVKHQYIGIFLVLAIAAQIVLGWRHHVQFVATKTKGWLSKTHIILGRIVLPLAYVNIVLGMLLRGYGWFTMILVFVTIGLETAFLAYILLYASKKKVTDQLRANESGPPQGDEAEEYFQLAGDDDFSDSDGEHDEARVAKGEAQRAQADRLRRLDRV